MLPSGSHVGSGVDSIHQFTKERERGSYVGGEWQGMGELEAHFLFKTLSRWKWLVDLQLETPQENMPPTPYPSIQNSFAFCPHHPSSSLKFAHHNLATLDCL